MRSLAAAGKRLNEDQKRKWDLYKRWVKCFNANREKIVGKFLNIVGNSSKGLLIQDLQDEELYIAKCFPSVTYVSKGYFLQINYGQMPNCFRNERVRKFLNNFDFNSYQNQGWFIPKFVHIISRIHPLNTIPLKPFVFRSDVVMPWEIWVVRKDKSVLIDDLFLLRVGVEVKMSKVSPIYECKDLKLNPIFDASLLEPGEIVL